MWAFPNEVGDEDPYRFLATGHGYIVLISWRAPLLCRAEQRAPPDWDGLSLAKFPRAQVVRKPASLLAAVETGDRCWSTVTLFIVVATRG